MCTVTFWPNRNGYVLGMNRDEARSRPAGLRPFRLAVANKTVLHPGEVRGGTWISLNEGGNSFALVNWYAVRHDTPAPVTSRGEVILAIRALELATEVHHRLLVLALPAIRPFRLIGVFPSLSEIHEWCWNGNQLARVNHDWEPMQWISSGWDEPGAQKSRSAIFERHRTLPDAGTISWLRRLHSSHEDESGPYSTCMHRDDAATVSYTEINVHETHGVMRYSAGPLCEGRPLTEDFLPLP